MWTSNWAPRHGDSRWGPSLVREFTPGTTLLVEYVSH